MHKNLKLLLRILCAALLLFLLIPLTACDKTEPSDFVFVENDGGYTLTSVRQLNRKVVIPDTYNGSKVTEIGDQAFFANGALRGVVIPASVERIGESAFENCEKLNEVTFEKGGACHIGRGAFAGCRLLSDLTLNSSVRSIDKLAFENCISLSRVKCDETLESIAPDAFRNCESLILDVSEGSYAAEFAKENRIPTDSFSSDLGTYLLILMAAFIAGCVLAAYLIYEKKKKKKSRKPAEKT